jgi:hypothetical protein
MASWLTLNRSQSDTLRQVMDEIGSGSHRATAVVAGAFVEDHLTTLIRCRMVNDQRMLTDMFEPGRALGDFGTKINLGYLIGLYTKDAWKELDNIRRIRNEFAHKIETASFNLQHVKARCENLVIWQRIKIKIRAEGKIRQGGKIIVTIGEQIDDEEQELRIVDLIQAGSPLSPYARYVTACRFFIAAFSIIIHVKPEGAAPFF